MPNLVDCLGEMSRKAAEQYWLLSSTLLQDILHPSNKSLNVLLQTANKLGLSNNKKIFFATFQDAVNIQTKLSEVVTKLTNY
jgi:uncharacterized membrane protein YcaP (DUF421 family)